MECWLKSGLPNEERRPGKSIANKFTLIEVIEMQKCYFSNQFHVSRTVARILWLVLGIFYIGFGIWGFLESMLLWWECSICLAIGVLMHVYGILIDWNWSKEYAIDQDGLSIRYWGKYTYQYTWNEIGQICLVEVHPGRNYNVFDHVIWCNLKKDRKWPPQIPRPLREYEIRCFYFRTIVTIEYTKERLEGFQLCSGREIPDYRNEVYR